MGIIPPAPNAQQSVLGRGTTQTALVGTPALRLLQAVADASGLLGGGATFEATNGATSWLLGGICGTVGTPGNPNGYPGGLAFFYKLGDGAAPGTLTEGMRLTMLGNFGVGTNAATTKLAVAGIVAHTVDNTYSFGTPALRASTIYAGAGTINTSDAREKTDVASLTPFEIAAATDLAREIGTFRFLASIARKGEDEARHHVGMTVQRAIAIMEEHGLDPLAYAFICHDTWEAVPPSPAVEGHDAEYDEAGEMIRLAVLPQEATPGSPAGDRYGFRTDQLLLFIARGFEARLAALEAKAG